MKKNGFVVTELLIYLILLGMLSVLLFSWWIMHHSGISKMNNIAQSCVSIQSVYAILEQDIAQAYPDSSLWQIDGNKLSFKTDQGIVSYIIKKKSLYRTVSESPHKRRSKSILSLQATDISWSLAHNQGEVARVSCILAGLANKPAMWHFGVENGSIA